MNLIAGILAGGAIGWVAFTVLNVNSDRGMLASLLIGAGGGALGVALAPMIGAADGGDGQINLFALVVAAATAAGCLTIGNMIVRRRKA